jgi:hypothetical protein
MATIAVNTAPATLKQLFDRQVATFAAAGLASEAELTALFPLLEQIGTVTEGEGRIPFIIVPQGPALTFRECMAKVVLDGKTGLCILPTDSHVTNLDQIPLGHYLAVDVEDGRAMLNTKPSACLARFKTDNRFGGTVNEGISVVTYEPKILQHHGLDLPGSCYDGYLIPCLCIDCELYLGAHIDGALRPTLGSLSCGGRLGS